MKHIKNYAILWTVLIILYNLVCLLTTNERYGISKFSGSFWVGYGFITASFISHLFYAFFAFGEKNKEKRVLNIPLLIISFVELGFMVIIGVLCMTTPFLPYWVGIIVCYAVLAFSVIFLLSAKVTGEKVANANIVLNAKTSSMRGMVDKAQELVIGSKTPEIKSMVAHLYDAIRYSDTISSEETKIDEMRISDGLEDLENMIQNATDSEKIQQKVDALLLLVEKRNNKCKASKRQV